MFSYVHQVHQPHAFGVFRKIITVWAQNTKPLPLRSDARINQSHPKATGEDLKIRGQDTYRDKLFLEYYRPVSYYIFLRHKCDPLVYIVSCFFE